MIRKTWLWLLWAIATESLFHFLDLLEMPDDVAVRAPAVVMASFCIVTAAFLGTLLKFYILYYCAYKHPGTKYLTFCLIVGPLQLLKEFKDLQADVHPLLLGILVFYFALNIAWYYFGWRLRALNKQLQRQEKDSSLASASSSSLTICSSEA